jgi:hypothetical protein
VTAGAGGVDVAGLEQAESALADVGELVGHDGIEARFVEGELYEAALGRPKVQGLGTTPAGTGAQLVGAPP